MNLKSVAGGVPGGCVPQPDAWRACGKFWTGQLREDSLEEVRVEVLTDLQTLSEVRQALDEALKSLLPGLLHTRWEDETLHLSGPGAEGTVTLESGQLVGRARLSPPASLMRSTIEQKITSLLQTVATAGDDG